MGCIPPPPVIPWQLLPAPPTPPQKMLQPCCAPREGAKRGGTPPLATVPPFRGGVGCGVGNSTHCRPPRPRTCTFTRRTGAKNRSDLFFYAKININKRKRENTGRSPHPPPHPPPAGESAETDITHCISALGGAAPRPPRPPPPGPFWSINKYFAHCWGPRLAGGCCVRGCPLPCPLPVGAGRAGAGAAPGRGGGPERLGLGLTGAENCGTRAAAPGAPRGCAGGVGGWRGGCGAVSPSPPPPVQPCALPRTLLRPHSPRHPPPLCAPHP